MKTKSFILIASVLALSLSSCGNKENPIETPIIKVVIGNEPVAKDFSNPVLIFGSSFGNYFQTLYKVGRFDEMLKFTSSGSIKKYGTAKIRKMYETMDFAYTIKLKSKTGTDTIILNYEAEILATKHMLRLPIVIENDTVKIVLQSLKGLQ